MEASTTKTFMQPKSLADLLPNLSGILSKEAIQSMTAKKKPRSTIAQTQTAQKVIKPMTLAEMRADILALKSHSPRRFTQAPPSNKKGWNSSVKIEKKITHTANGQMKNNTVRKVLNFQPKPKVTINPRITMANSETPKFPKPEFRAKKSLHLQVTKSSVRISGICNIPQTPAATITPVKTKFTTANKENYSYRANINRKLLPPPTPVNHDQIASKMSIDTPLLNSSWKSGSDASFLQREKEIHDVEEKVKAMAEEHTLENIAEVSPPVSTPFKEYRSVQEYFNNSSGTDNSTAYNDNTIMCFDKPSVCNDNEKREESVIVSLCDLFNKASVTNCTKTTSIELDNLLEVEKQTEQKIKMIESVMQMLNDIKEADLKSLQNVRKLIDEKRNGQISKSEKDRTLVAETKTPKVEKVLSPEKSPILSRPCSVIKACTKSPSYKIPKKNLGLRKRVICKSMPNVSSELLTPVKDIEGRALNMYMKMKEQMNFLSTPMINRTMMVPDTPAVTSHNLQLQLDKLYGS